MFGRAAGGIGSSRKIKSRFGSLQRIKTKTPKSPGSAKSMSAKSISALKKDNKNQGDTSPYTKHIGIPEASSTRDHRLMTTEPGEQTKRTIERQYTEEALKGSRYELGTIFHEEEDETLGNMEDGRSSKVEFQKLQIIDLSTGLVAGIGAFITVIAYDLQFDQRDNDLLERLLWIVFGTTKVAILLNVLRYLQKLKFAKSRNLISEKEDLISSGEIWDLSIEIVLLLLQPYPFLADYKIHAYNKYEAVTYYYYVNDVFSILLCVRLYILLRILLNNTNYLSPSAKRLSSMYGADNNYLYACKCLMRNAPIITALILFIGSIFVFGYMLRICERPLNRHPEVHMSFTSYWDSMWCIILTMTTVGYGDFFARTHFGRLISFFCCIWGVFVVSLMVVTLGNVLSMNAAEERALIVLERLELRKNMKSEAAYVVTGLAKMSLNKKKNRTDSTKAQNRKSMNKVKRHLSEFKDSARQVKNMVDDSNLGEEMARQFDKMRDEIIEVREQHKELYDVIAGLTEALQRKVNTENSIKLEENEEEEEDGGTDEREAGEQPKKHQRSFKCKLPTTKEDFKEAVDSEF